MKKLLLLAAIFALVFASCPTDDGNGDGNGNGGNGQTTLTITNSSDFANLEFSFGDVAFSALGRGGESTKTVSAGTRFIYVSIEYTFQDPALIQMGIGIHQMFEVNDVFTCEENKNNQFNFTNTTDVTMSGGDTGYRNSGGLTTGTLRNILTGIENYYKDN